MTMKPQNRPRYLAVEGPIGVGKSSLAEILAESLGALAVELSAEEIAALEAAVPAEAVAGTRYDERQMKHLDSEK